MNVQSITTAPTPSVGLRPVGTNPAEVTPPEPSPVWHNSGISKAGEVFSKLSALQQSDPEKLKDTAADLAAALRAEASRSQSGSLAALGKLANAFQKVARTGDLASLAPQPPEPGNPTRPVSQYTRNAAPSTADVQAMHEAMSFVAARLA